jgi:glucans biosynthesis protein C
VQEEERIHALDAVRAFALLLGVFFHAAMSFIDVEVESLNWAIADGSQSDALVIFVGVSHLFRMSLFFFIAGYFAHLVYHRRGAAAFVENRAVRIVVPFIVGWCVIAPLLRIIWRWGQARSGGEIAMGLWPSQEQWLSGSVNLTHLWFLYYLMLIYVLFVGLRHVTAERLDRSGNFRRGIDGILRTLIDRRLAPVVLSLPVAFAGAFEPSWNAGAGMPTPDRSLIPELIPIVGYGAVFATGWIFRRSSDLLQLVTARVKSSLWLTLVSLLSTSVLATVLGTQPNLLPGLMRFLTAIAATSLMWYFNLALIGYALKRFAAPSPTTRYVADASYWIYIAHLPVVCALQVLVAHWPLHWTIKYPFIVTVAFVLLFASYHLLVRYSFIGAVLNGRKYRDGVAKGRGNHGATAAISSSKP